MFFVCLTVMFTGIVEETGKVLLLEEQPKAWRLVVEVPTLTEGLQQGDSIAVNGCCLTVVGFSRNRIELDLLEESKRSTSPGSFSPGSPVNLERALLPTTRMGGHFVSGHVDETGVIEQIEQIGKDFLFRIEPKVEHLRYIVPKGCITVDGVSLTVAEVDDTGFTVWLIPHTIHRTHLHTKKVGDLVNLEYDLLAKYAEKLMTSNS